MPKYSSRDVDRLSDRTLTPPDPTYAEEQAALLPCERDIASAAWGLLNDAVEELSGVGCSALADVLSELLAAYAGNATPDQFRGWDTMTAEQRQVALDAWRMGNAAAKEDSR